MRLTRIIPPAETPISLAEAKAQCRILYDDDDLLVQSYLDAAVSHLDGWHGVLGRCLVTQTWRAEITRLGESIALPFPDTEIVSAEYSDAAGGLLAYEWHESLARPALLPVGGWGRPVSVTFTAGFGPAHAVPDALKNAMRLLVQHFEARDTEPEIAASILRTVGLLIAPFRVRTV